MNDDSYYEIPHGRDSEVRHTSRNHPRRDPRRRKKQTGLGVLSAVLAIIIVVLAVFAFSLKSQLNTTKDELQKQSQTVEQYKQDIEQYKKDADQYKQNAADWQKKYEDLSAAKKNDQQGKICYLTFDDGPSGNTLKIIEVLKKYNAKGTFFVTGNSRTEYMKNIVDSGNAIALHTYTHNYDKIYASQSAYFEDLEKIRALVKEKTGVDTKMIRFPGGSSNTVSNVSMKTLAQAVEDKGYTYYDWNCDSGDAAGTNVAPEKLLAHIKNDTGGQKRLTVLMHDTEAKSTTVTALPQIIEFLRSKGYTFDVLSNKTQACHHNIGR